MDDSDYLSDKLVGKSILYSRRTERYYVRVRADLQGGKLARRPARASGARGEGGSGLAIASRSAWAIWAVANVSTRSRRQRCSWFMAVFVA